MTTTRRTHLVVVATVVLVSAYTLAMSLNGIPGDTVSETMRSWAGRWWVVPMGWTALAGHWWGPRVPAWWPRWTGYVLAALGALGLGLGFAGVGAVESWWVWWIQGAVGAVLGAALWPLSRGG